GHRTDRGGDPLGRLSGGSFRSRRPARPMALVGVRRGGDGGRYGLRHRLPRPVVAVVVPSHDPYGRDERCLLRAVRHSPVNRATSRHQGSPTKQVIWGNVGELTSKLTGGRHLPNEPHRLSGPGQAARLPTGASPPLLRALLES